MTVRLTMVAILAPRSWPCQILSGWGQNGQNLTGAKGAEETYRTGAKGAESRDVGALHQTERCMIWDQGEGGWRASLGDKILPA